MPEPIIEYRDLHKSFDTVVLDGVSLIVEKGEIFAIVGPSGTGKSVLLKTTIGLIVPDSGDVLVQGRSVFDAAPDELQQIRRQAGYVFQYAALFDSMNVYENVAMGLPENAEKVFGKDEVYSRIRQALDDVNLDPDVVMPKLPAELSGGMRKRVGFARAIVGQPRILLYDEPVTGLDPVNTAAIDHLILKIARTTDVTSLIVTHDIEGVLAVCNRIALLEGGKLRFVGTPKEFKESTLEIVRAFADRGAAAAAAVRLVEQR
jgi:phospholipid/cholesterol/gamma-HCH transport system ATP-binding protein